MPEEITSSKFLVLNLVQEITINDPEGNETTLKFNKLNFFGMCPVFVTEKGAKDYVTANNLSENQIIKLKG